MPLKTDALQKGLNSFVAVDTHVTKGSKLAKGQDSVAGEIAQFSSLMNVMQEDFALMDSMQRQYQTERSTVEPTVHSDNPVELEEVEDTVGEPNQELVLLDGEFIEAVPEVERIDLPLVEFQQFEVVDEGMDFVQQVLSAPVLDISTESLVDDVVEQPLTTAPIVQQGIQTLDLLPQVATTDTVNPKMVEVPNVKNVPEVLLKEIMDVFKPLTSEVISTSKEEIPLTERVDLPSFLREGVRLLDDTIEIEAVPEDEEVTVTKQLPSQAVVASDVEVEALSMQDVASGMEFMNSGVVQAVGAAAVAATSSSVVTTSVSSDAVSIQQTKESTDVKKAKLFNNTLTRQHFEDQLEEGQEAGKDKMSFASKLLQRLELVVMDPLGRMDVEIAQEVLGVQVKTIVPSEMIQALQGIEQDLQFALNNQGLELSSFQLQERDEEYGNLSSNVENTQRLEDLAEENDEKSLMGGMLVSRRV